MRVRDHRPDGTGETRWAARQDRLPPSYTAQRVRMDERNKSEWVRRLIHKARNRRRLWPLSEPRWIRPLLFGASGAPLTRYAQGRGATSVASVNPNGDSAEPDWPDPISLGPPPPPELPVAGLPPWLRDHTESVAAAAAASQDMALLLGLTAISTAVANKGLVVIKDGYTEPLQIWTVSVAPPGARKSPVFSHMMRPIHEYEAEEERRFRSGVRAVKEERLIVEKALKKAKKEAAGVLFEKGRAEAYKEAMDTVGRLQKDFDELSVRPPDVITIADITPERLGQRMTQNFGRAAIVSPEGDVFKIMSGLYSDGRLNLQSYKKAWTGEEAITDDRISREGTRVERPALVVGITTQPIVLESLKEKNQFRGEGVLGRFLYVQPVHHVGYRPTGDEVPPLNLDAQNRYARCVRALVDARPADVEGENWIPHELPLSSDAAEMRNAFAQEVEESVRPGETLDGIEDWGTKLTGNTVRLAGLIHLAWQVQEANDLWADPVSARSMETAVKLGRALIPHSLYVFDQMDAVPEVSRARYVWKRITTYAGDEPLTVRELHRRTSGKKEFKRVGPLKATLSRLEEHKHVRLKEQDSRGGRNPSPIIQVNPKALDDMDTSDRSPGQAEETAGPASRGVPVAAGAESD